MKILITGANGFVGRNLTVTLQNIRDGRDHSVSLSSAPELLLFDKDTAPDLLERYCAECDFVFHLAGVNRPEKTEEFMEGNFGFTSTLLDTLRKHGNKAPVLITSSIQAELDNPYGQSKKAGEDLLFRYSQETGAEVLVYRLPNVFGKWCRPNYNSAVATFCHNIARDLPITVSDESHAMSLVYIDDVVAELLRALMGRPDRDGRFCRVQPVLHTTLGEIVGLLRSFRQSRANLSVPDMASPLAVDLYATYLSYLPADQFSYPLTAHCDDRGSFTEVLRSAHAGQVSVNISKPGITKGNHWHHTKNEKFLVVSGQGVIRFRAIDSEQILEYPVSGDRLTVVDIPTGYTHSIVNLGQTDMVTLMWCSECFDPKHPDTYFCEVERHD